MVCIQLNKKARPLLSLKDILTIFFLLFFAELIIYTLPNSMPYLVKISIIRLIEIIILFSYISFLNIFQQLFLGNNFKALKKGVIISLIIGLVFFVFFFMIKYLFSVSILNFFLFKPPGNKEIIILFMAGGIISPMTEELFFRGIIYQKLRQSKNIFSAILISSTIFAIFHLTKNSFPIIQFFGGILFAFSYEYSKNLITPYFIHMTGNIFLFSIPLLYEIDFFKNLLFST